MAGEKCGLEISVHKRSSAVHSFKPHERLHFLHRSPKHATKPFATFLPFRSFWRTYRGKRLGPYFQLAYRDRNCQHWVYLGRSQDLADRVRDLLARLPPLPCPPLRTSGFLSHSRLHRMRPDGVSYVYDWDRRFLLRSFQKNPHPPKSLITRFH